jgi:hypothetical protein
MNPFSFESLLALAYGPEIAAKLALPPTGPAVASDERRAMLNTMNGQQRTQMLVLECVQETQNTKGN